MPPNASRCQGDFFIQPSTNPSVNGFGNLKVSKDINLVGSSVDVELNAVSQALKIKTAKSLSLDTLNGDIVATAKKVGDTGSITLGAEKAGLFSAKGGSLGMNLSTTDVGDMELNSTGNFSTSVSKESTLTSAGHTMIRSTGEEENVSIVSDKNNVNITAKKDMNIHGKEITNVFGAAVNIGTGITNTHVSLGRDETTLVDIKGQAPTLGSASSVTTVPGSLVVQGNTTSVESNVVKYKDSLLELNALPGALARDSGLVMTRHGADVAVGASDATASLSSDVAAGATVLPFAVAAGGEGWYVKMTEAPHVETHRIESVDGLNYTIPALANAFTTAATVELYQKAAAAFVFHESSDQFRLMYTEHKAVSGNVADPASDKYADLHIKKLIVEESIATASSATSSYDLLDNSDTPVSIAGLKHRGSYQVTIESPIEGGATGTFYVSKASSAHTDGSVFCMSSAAALTSEEVSVSWPANSPPAIYHSANKLGGVGGLLPYKVYFNTVSV